MYYVLNSAVITGPGVYKYRLASPEEVKSWLRARNWVSRVGYVATIEHIKQLTGIQLSLSREETRMEPGDQALVVRLKYRLQDPTQKGQWQPGTEDWEYGILTRIE